MALEFKVQGPAKSSKSGVASREGREGKKGKKLGVSSLYGVLRLMIRSATANTCGVDRGFRRRSPGSQPLLASASLPASLARSDIPAIGGSNPNSATPRESAVQAAQNLDAASSVFERPLACGVHDVAGARSDDRRFR